MLMVPTCSKQLIKHCAMLRQQGMSYEEIAAAVGKHKATVSRHLRVYEKYGQEVFPDTRNPRETAIQCGDNKFDGMACVKCGSTLRYVSNRNCVECCRKADRKRRLKNAKR